MIALITMHELQGLTVHQLGELHQLLTLLLTAADPASQERQNVLASLENIERAMGCQARLTARRFTMKP